MLHGYLFVAVKIYEFHLKSKLSSEKFEKSYHDSARKESPFGDLEIDLQQNKVEKFLTLDLGSWEPIPVPKISSEKEAWKPNDDLNFDSWGKSGVNREVRAFSQNQPAGEAEKLELEDNRQVDQVDNFLIYDEKMEEMFRVDEISDDRKGVQLEDSKSELITTTASIAKVKIEETVTSTTAKSATKIALKHNISRTVKTEQLQTTGRPDFITTKIARNAHAEFLLNLAKNPDARVRNNQNLVKLAEQLRHVHKRDRISKFVEKPKKDEAVKAKVHAKERQPERDKPATTQKQLSQDPKVLSSNSLKTDLRPHEPFEQKNLHSRISVENTTESHQVLLILTESTTERLDLGKNVSLRKSPPKLPDLSNFKLPQPPPLILPKPALPQPPKTPTNLVKPKSVPAKTSKPDPLTQMTTR